MKKLTKKPAIIETTKMGRPSKYNSQLANAIIAIVENIGFVAVASESLGVSRRTAYEWCTLGESGDERYIGFATGIAAAKAKYATKLIGEVHDPRWLLQKLDKAQFGDEPAPTTTVNVQNNQTNITREDALKELKQMALTDPELLELLKSII